MLGDGGAHLEIRGGVRGGEGRHGVRRAGVGLGWRGGDIRSGIRRKRREDINERDKEKRMRGG